jgi:sugar phosphate isomerase/epimerase
MRYGGGARLDESQGRRATVSFGRPACRLKAAFRASVERRLQAAEKNSVVRLSGHEPLSQGRGGKSGLHFGAVPALLGPSMKALLSLALVMPVAGGLLAQDAANPTGPAEKLGWKVAMHAYTFKEFPIAQAIDKTAALGLKYMSLSGSVNLDGQRKPRTIDLTDEEMGAIVKRVHDAGIKLVNIGVVQLPPEEAKSRQVFDFAKKWGIDTLVAEPEPSALDVVEKLCKEYNIKVAIHNHPRPSRYWNPDTVLAAVKDRSPLLGACADTGHWMRSGLDPVQCLSKLEGRVICLHFKDLAERTRNTHDVPWGVGVGDVKGMMTELKRQGFHGVFGIEYESDWLNSSPAIAQGIRYFYATCAELAAGQ